MRDDNHYFPKFLFWKYFTNISLINFVIDISEIVTYPIKKSLVIILIPSVAL